MRRCASNFLDTIFDSALVLGAARVVVISVALVLLLAGFYICGSIIVRIRRGEWLHKAGPFETQIAEVGIGAGELAPLAEGYSHTLRQNEELERKLAERDMILAEFRGGD